MHLRRMSFFTAAAALVAYSIVRHVEWDGFDPQFYLLGMSLVGIGASLLFSTWQVPGLPPGRAAGYAYSAITVIMGAGYMLGPDSISGLGGLDFPLLGIWLLCTRPTRGAPIAPLGWAIGAYFVVLTFVWRFILEAGGEAPGITLDVGHGLLAFWLIGVAVTEPDGRPGDPKPI